MQEMGPTNTPASFCLKRDYQPYSLAGLWDTPKSRLVTISEAGSPGPKLYFPPEISTIAQKIP